MKFLAKAALTVSALALAPAAEAASLIVDIVDITSLGRAGNPGNTVLAYDIGAYARVSKLAYEVTIATIDPGYFSEQGVLFGSSEAAYVSFTPGFDLFSGGTAIFSGTEDWQSLGADFFVGEDGILRLEFTDSYNIEALPNGTWNGKFVITYDSPAAVPEPATWALTILGFGMVGGNLRSRRRIRALAV